MDDLNQVPVKLWGQNGIYNEIESGGHLHREGTFWYGISPEGRGFFPG